MKENHRIKVGMNVKTEILKILRNTSGYVSGQELCKQLGVSRTAIWKVINHLKEEGYLIEAVSNKGYKLMNTPDVISTSELESRINTEIIGQKIKYYEEVDSTNTVAKRIAEEKDTNGLLVIAEKQIQGKGRRGRNWDSPKGTGIFMSIILKPRINPSNASMLTLIAALSVIRSFKKLLSVEAFIKWPNDIVINGKKVCGILTEMSAEIDYINHVIVGIGINVSTKEFPSEISTVATSLFIEGNESISRAEIVSNILEEFETCYKVFLETENLVYLVEQYNKVLINMGREVRIMERDKEYLAIALGINERGELIVEESETKQIKHIIAGEVSVRGVYGYV